MTGSMHDGRAAPSVTLLANGLVLVAGGWNAGALASAELYDLKAATWTTTGSMARGRSGHSATLLADGRVLVAGGDNATGGRETHSSAELYDVLTGAWTPTGQMVDERMGHTATLLRDGRVLVVGGESVAGGHPSGTAELYDPGTGTWTATGAMIDSRSYGHTATLLPNGDVLAIGGAGIIAQGSQASAELYHPATGSWTSAGSMAEGRAGHSAELLRTGAVFVSGGGELPWAELYETASGAWRRTADGGVTGPATVLQDGTVLVTSEAGAQVFDPEAEFWSDTQSLPADELRTALVLLPDGMVLAVGSCCGVDDANAVIYDPDHAVLTPQLPSPTPIPGGPAWSLTKSMVTGRSQPTATLLTNGQVLVAGGQPAGPVGYPGPQGTTATEFYDPATGLWASGPNMVASRLMHTATRLANGDVLVAGGASSRSSAERYSPATRSWSAAGTMIEDRFRHTATLLRTGKVLVTGGCCSSASAELFDPATNSWIATGSMSDARSDHTATLLLDGTVLVAGGGRLSSAELYDPATGSWTPTGKMATPRSFHTATLLPDGRVLVVGGQDATGSALAGAELYDPRTGLWAFAGRMTSARESHTATLLADGTVLVASKDWVAGRMVSAELFDPATGSWTTSAAMVEPRVSHTATLLSDGTVLVAGGDEFPLFAELYHPASAP
jgi:Galactose oxidase, central domain/Kelch motif